ncbi:GtrA family protein [uncultured Kiloniella sp.]|uniref:GtrA family protein n=1 Tax=uncultured Kiloniella sp. TaxID=1133091 RepID=UPI00262954B5|nr:GtrA family protein [uncultured Kiloniella sp.]
MNLLLSYCLFAVFATIANIVSQDVTLRFYSGPFALIMSVGVGTAIGLVTKYLLDKRYIFRYRTSGIGHESKIFMLYAVMGVFTTSVFWAFEFGFHFIFDDKIMRYLGGIIGLAIGYWIKYQLDKKYVFIIKGIKC